MNCRLLVGLAIALTACSSCSARLHRASANAGLEADPVQGQPDPSTRRNFVRNFIRVNHPRVNVQSGGTAGRGSTLSISASSTGTANTNMASSGTVAVSPNIPAASISVITPTISTVAAVPQSANVMSINPGPTASSSANVMSINPGPTATSSANVVSINPGPTATSSAIAVSIKPEPSAASSATAVSSAQESSGWPEGNFFRPSISFEFIDLPEMIDAILDRSKPFWSTPVVDFGGRMKRDVNSYRSENWDKPQDPVSDFYERFF